MCPETTPIHKCLSGRNARDILGGWGLSRPPPREVKQGLKPSHHKDFPLAGALLAIRIIQSCISPEERSREERT